MSNLSLPSESPTGEAAGLRAELDWRREWKFLRRLRWALRGDRRAV
jgi:hypothetical protein